MALRPFQNSSSRLMLVLRPPITTDRLVTVEFMTAPFPGEAMRFRACRRAARRGQDRASTSARVAHTMPIRSNQRRLESARCTSNTTHGSPITKRVVEPVPRLHRYLSGLCSVAAWLPLRQISNTKLVAFRSDRNTLSILSLAHVVVGERRLLD